MIINFASLNLRIEGNRKEWIPLILLHQNLNIDVTLYICDRHFHGHDLIKNGSQLRLKAGAKPQLFTLLRPGITYESNTNSSSVTTHQLNTNPSSNAMDKVQISREAYQRLVDESIELIKAKKVIEKLRAEIEKKDGIIENLNTPRESIDVSHLTTVSSHIL